MDNANRFSIKTFPMSNNLLDDLLVDRLMKVMKPICYRGCCIWPNEGKFLVYDRECENLEDAKQKIDDSYEWVEKSLKK